MSNCRLREMMFVNINKSSIAENTYDLIKKSMDASALRGKVIANNIANINTKGYKKLYVTFEENLNDSMGKNYVLKTGNNKHIQTVSGNGEITVQRDENTSMRQDGNNVDIDLEMTNQAANTLMYNALVKQVNSKISLTSYIIQGGK
jgi:flagellar basal-body rod protein FlgB